MCVFLQKIGGLGCYLAKASALSGHAIAFGLHDNLMAPQQLYQSTAKRNCTKNDT